MLAFACVEDRVRFPLSDSDRSLANSVYENLLYRSWLRWWTHYGNDRPQE